MPNALNMHQLGLCLAFVRHPQNYIEQVCLKVRVWSVVTGGLHSRLTDPPSVTLFGYKVCKVENEPKESCMDGAQKQSLIQPWI